jgi:hypothetical protein
VIERVETSRENPKEKCKMASGTDKLDRVWAEESSRGIGCGIRIADCRADAMLGQVPIGLYSAVNTILDFGRGASPSRILESALHVDHSAETSDSASSCAGAHCASKVLEP